MKIRIQKTNNTKQNVFWDVDDVVLASSEAIVNILNETELKPRGLKPKTYADCKDWNYKSIWQGMTNERTLELFESDEFWSTVKIHQKFYKMIDSGLLDNYNTIFVTKGTEINLQKKEAYLQKNLMDREPYFQYQFIGMSEPESKGQVDMEGGIQIDDVFSNLICTNARIKILMQNGITTRHNNALLMKPSLDDTIYNVDYLDQVEEILRFNLIEKL